MLNRCAVFTVWFLQGGQPSGDVSAPYDNLSWDKSDSGIFSCSGGKYRCTGNLVGNTDWLVFGRYDRDFIYVSTEEKNIRGYYLMEPVG